MEVSRHESLKGSQGFEGAGAAATQQHVVERIGVKPGPLRDLRDRDVMGIAPCVDAVDGGVAGRDHDRDEITKLWDAQQQSQKVALCAESTPAYPSFMPYDPKRSRAAVQAIIDGKPIKPATWCRKARLSPNALAAFLKGTTDSLKVSTAVALAEAVDANPLALMGITPSADMVLPEEALSVALGQLATANTQSAQTNEAVQNASRLILALAQSAGVVPLFPRPTSPPPVRPRPKR